MNKIIQIFFIGGVSVIALVGVWTLYVIFVTLVGEDDGLHFTNLFSPLALSIEVLVLLFIFAGAYFINKRK